MVLLQAHALIKTYGIRTIFNIDKLEIHDGDRIGLVGCNGAGKSTLLHILYGDEPCDSGTIDRRGAIALIDQSGDSEGTRDGRLLRSFSLSGSACKSGGERTRLALAAAFAQDAPLLLADEPTTNLDMAGIETLQQMLTGYRGALVVISHDRALLDALCTTIWALEDGALRVFSGSYSGWAAQRERERDFAQFEYDQARAEKARLAAEARNLRDQAHGLRKMPKRMGNSEARLHKREATVGQAQIYKRAKGLLNRIEQMEKKERPSDLPVVRMTLGAAIPITAKTAARVEGLTVRYGGRTVLADVSFSLAAGTRTVMTGANGAGKTTAAEHLVRGGDCARLAAGVKLGYFSQNHDLLDPSRSALENVRAASARAEHEVRTILANLCIAGDDVFKPVGVLSGGERAKTALACLLASDCNLLVLDEPTNPIDLYTAEALEALLQRWRGTMLVITHDRRLIERVAQRLLFVENGGIRAFDGTWAQWRAEQARLAAPPDDMRLLIDQMRRAALG